MSDPRAPSEPPPPADMPRPLDGRDSLIAAITTFLADQDARTLEDIRASLARELEAAGPDAMAALCGRLNAAAGDWRYYPRDPLARRIHEVLADRLLDEHSTLYGIEHVDAVAGVPVVLVANHLSYSDANLLDVLLERAGGGALSDRLTVMAGPKVYSSLQRRFSSLCYATIKTPQTSARSTGDAVMSPRDVARLARQVIGIALERLRLGEALLVFGEGVRSRTGQMQPLLSGVARYLDCPGVRVLPVGIVGTEALFPIGEDAFRPVRIVARVGPPLDAGALREQAGGNRRLMLDSVGLAIGSLLPPDYRGAYGDDVAGLDDARRVLTALAQATG